MEAHPLSRQVSFALLCLAVATPAYLQAAPKSLDALVVVGSRTPAQISEIPGTVWVLEGEELEEQFRAGQDLKTVLGKLVPGMDLAPETRTNYGQNMRGRSVLVMIDGVSLNGSRGLSRQFDSIDPFNVERIEVLSGASAIYGGGSTGGIVNIISKKGHAGSTRFSTELGGSSGFNNSEDRTLRAGQAIAGGNERISGRLAIAAQDKGAMVDGNGNPIMPDISQTDLQFNRSVDILGSTQIRIDDNQRLDLMAQLYDSGYNGDQGVWLGPYLSEINNPDIRDGFSSDREPGTERYMVNLAYQHLDFLGHTAYVQASVRNEESSFHPYPYQRASLPQSYFGASRQDTRQYLLKGLLAKNLGKVKLSYGVDLDREDFAASQMIFDNASSFPSGGLVFNEEFTVDRYPDYRVEGIAAYLQGEWQATDRLQLNAGIRQRYARLEMEPFIGTQQAVEAERGLVEGADAIPGGESDYDVTLLNAGAIYKLNNGHQIWANVSQGFEIPDPGKVAGRGSYSLQGNRYILTNSLNIDDNPIPGLKTNQVEFGWRTYQARWDAQLASYYTWSDKEAQTNRTTLTVDVVDRKTRDYGIEGALNWRADEQWSFGASAHYVRSEIEDSTGSWQKNLVTAASLPNATAFVRWQKNRSSVRLQGAKAFDISDDAGDKIEGYTTFDLMASHPLPLGQLDLAVTNLLDTQYDTVWGQRAQLFYGFESLFDFKGQGRTYTLTYSVDY
ncbi:TonB-dependent receptor [Halopseudomonas salegens]|uniref:Ferric aerobactin receptor n=1 Tax=Halopseudomonas salegens TaxID=1434072 RepID=A0A1H2FGZ4_9GAMM|nr:TonB-dependent receptor [Halopseudomonas salegens]SDU06543.1 iron complex outermembrane recepter protein [Halopseudomonas salegens]